MVLFSPITGILGGAILGMSAASLLLLSGNILGASGIVSSAILPPFSAFRDPVHHWKLIFLASFLLTTLIYCAADYDMEVLAAAPFLSPFGKALAGFLVGFGTKLGNGCTSGHGICGLARLSRRSLAAVMTFMFTAMVTTFLTAETASWSAYTEFLRRTPVSTSFHRNTLLAAAITVAVTLAAVVVPVWPREKRDANDRAKLLPGALSGSLFAVGLFISQMVYPSKVFGFLNVAGIKDGTWDPTLAFVMGGGAAISFLGYQFTDSWRVIKFSKVGIQYPLVLRPGTEFCVPNNQKIDRQLVLGASIFGVGWGLAGVCPGPAIFLAATGVEPIIFNWWPGFFMGAYLANELKGYC